MSEPDGQVGVRELRLQTRAVLARIQMGESVEITAHGRPIARLMPLAEAGTPPVLERLERAGQLSRATRPGQRPRMRSSDGSPPLGDTLAELRKDRHL
ncbi:MAG TPA: type II toxin-antitoxin system prevent-host-death family antitoxin [Ruania sp.]|nr:type II toxin-antitoxin system prevent-host-death family antitoxin [Ruania sp.]